MTRTTAVDDDVRYVDGAPGANTAASIVSIIGGILIVLLGLRVLLSLLGANRENAFADLIYGITYPFAAPFFGLFGYDVQYGVSRLEIETIFAIIIYALIFFGIARLLNVRRDSTRHA
jgi:YggT family protein